MGTKANPKRAIALGGGGPAAGLHIGVLEALSQKDIKFDVWSLSCIGAWVGIVYNQCNEGKEADETYDFFKKGVFRDDASYKRFPINTVFGADWYANTRAMMEFLSNPKSYEDIWVPHKMMDAFRNTLSRMYGHQFDNKEEWNPKDLGDWMKLVDRCMGRGAWFRPWDEGDINNWLLNDVMAVNPFVRFYTSMMYLSNVSGLSRICYPNSEFMKRIKFQKLKEKGKPHIFHNAWNLTKKRLELFSNQKMKNMTGVTYGGPINATTLCACSALPFIEETVEINGDTYCEGALVDTVNFKSLLQEHPDLDEIWVSRIVDESQVSEPENLHDGLANLCQLFAATVGEDDVDLFKYHIKDEPFVDKDGREKYWNGTLVEIPVGSEINFRWNHSNLDEGRKEGYEAAIEACEAYDAAGGWKQGESVKNTDERTEAFRVINEKKEREIDKKFYRKKKEEIEIDRLADALAEMPKESVDKLLKLLPNK